jgi:aspartate racemase
MLGHHGTVKTIGLLGGMSWESSVHYERIINTEVRRRLGGTHSADLVIRSYDFAEIERLQEAGDWETAGELLAGDARRLQEAGAGLVILCTNTMHRVADAIEAAAGVPFLHLGDALARAIRDAGLGRVGLLGTRYTMEEPFLIDRLRSHGIDVAVPEPADREIVHRVIFEELVRGRIEEASRRHLVEIVARLLSREVEGVVAGCTEIELLISADDVPCPFFPTTEIHALAAVDEALQPD